MQINRDQIKSEFINHISHQWYISSVHFPDYLTEVSLDLKTTNETYIDSTIEDFNSHFRYISKKFLLRRKKWRMKTLKMVHMALATEKVLGIHTILNTKDLEKMENEIGEFLYKARTFASELNLSDIGQAVRNYTVYIMFKEMNQIKSGFSQACFGYSMLYPFTDNYIDNTNFSAKEKMTYNSIIRDKIKGAQVKTDSIHQSKTCMLLDYIETEYKRDSNTDIYTLLLMMLEAQEISMTEQKKSNLSEDDRLHISIYKGGLSVLIDRYLINKPLTKEDIIFYLSFGFFLQLADDLLDIREDIKAGSQTIFTLDTSKEHLELLVNQLFAYVTNLFNSYTAINDKFKNFVLKNCYFLILYGVLESKEFLSSSYLEMLEKYFPVHYSYLVDVKIRMKQVEEPMTHIDHMKLLDDILLKFEGVVVK